MNGKPVCENNKCVICTSRPRDGNYSSAFVVCTLLYPSKNMLLKLARCSREELRFPKVMAFGKGEELRVKCRSPAPSV